MDDRDKQPLWHDWMKVGVLSNREKIRVCIQQLQQRWPGRYRFRVVASGTGGYEVYLSHQQDPP